MSIAEMHDVRKTYKLGEVDLHVLNGVSLSVKKGEFLSIMGPSGSGKSTMLHILGALDRPTVGKVLISGKNVSRMDDNELATVRRDTIGFIFQAFNLIPRLTALENVMFPMWLAGISADKRENRARELLESVGLGRRMHHVPARLSGGERQRVAISRALANRPQLILADEPTGNLDTKTGGEILNILRSVNDNGTTLVVITHDPGIAKLASRTVRMVDGKIISGVAS